MPWISPSLTVYLPLATEPVLYILRMSIHKRPRLLSPNLLTQWRSFSLCPVVLAFTLVACTFSFTYRQLDWLVPWHLGDYISFNSAQRSELEQRLEERLEWHCRTQLGAYAGWFREMHAEPLPFTRERLEQHYQQSLEFWRELMENLTPDIAALLLTASDAQVEELMSNLEQRNRELEKQYVTASRKRIRQRRIDRMEEMLRRWIGPLNAPQQQALERWAEDLGPGGEDWMASRDRWQRALDEAFTLRNNPEQFRARIHMLFADPRQLWPESYRKAYASMRERTMEMLAQITAVETPAQERHFRRQLLAWAEDFEQLACPAKSMKENTAGNHF